MSSEVETSLIIKRQELKVLDHARNDGSVLRFFVGALF